MLKRAQGFESRLKASLVEIIQLLHRHRVLQTFTHRQEGPRRDLLEQLQNRQNPAELRKRLSTMHGADIAYLLEALPMDDRRVVWEQLSADQCGRVLVEVSGNVCESLASISTREQASRAS